MCTHHLYPVGWNLWGGGGKWGFFKIKIPALSRTLESLNVRLFHRRLPLFLHILPLLHRTDAGHRGICPLDCVGHPTLQVQGIRQPQLQTGPTPLTTWRWGGGARTRRRRPVSYGLRLFQLAAADLLQWTATIHSSADHPTHIVSLTSTTYGALVIYGKDGGGTSGHHRRSDR